MKPKIKTSLVFKFDSVPYNYFGLILYIPAAYKWIAMDVTGYIYAYTSKPKKAEQSFYSQKGESLAIASVIYAGDWTESRLKVKRLKKVRA